MSSVAIIVVGVLLILLAAAEHRHVDDQWARGFAAGAGLVAFLTGIVLL